MRAFLLIAVVTVVAVGIGVIISLSLFFIKTGPSVYPKEVNQEILKIEEIDFRTTKAKEINSAIDLTLSKLEEKDMEPKEKEKIEQNLESVKSNIHKLRQILPESENNKLIENTVALLPKELYSDIPRFADIENPLGELEIYWETNFDLVEKGQVLYKRLCATCHGFQGDGVSVTPEELTVAPRDLTGKSHFVRRNGQIVKDGSVTFKFSSAEKGPALKEDIKDTIRNGLQGTPMPGFPGLTDEEIESIAEYIMTFGYVQWKFGVKPNPEIAELKIPDDLAQALEDKNVDLISEGIQQGRILYRAACLVCHGDIEDLGRNAVGLEGETNWLGPEGKPITTLPRNFAAEPFKKGTPKQLYRSIRLGIKGTPMPPHLFPQDQIWNLISYVMFLKEKPVEK